MSFCNHQQDRAAGSCCPPCRVPAYLAPTVCVGAWRPQQALQEPDKLQALQELRGRSLCPAGAGKGHATEGTCQQRHQGSPGPLQVGEHGAQLGAVRTVKAQGTAGLGFVPALSLEEPPCRQPQTHGAASRLGLSCCRSSPQAPWPNPSLPQLDPRVG